MYNTKRMKAKAIVLLLIVISFAGVAMPTALSLPSVACADTEVVTNIVISSWQRGAAKFAFSLSCLATPSNNVEAAFVSNVKLKMENVK